MKKVLIVVLIIFVLLGSFFYCVHTLKGEERVVFFIDNDAVIISKQSYPSTTVDSEFYLTVKDLKTEQIELVKLPGRFYSKYNIGDTISRGIDTKNTIK